MVGDDVEIECFNDAPALAFDLPRVALPFYGDGLGRFPGMRHVEGHVLHCDFYWLATGDHIMEERMGG